MVIKFCNITNVKLSERDNTRFFYDHDINTK